MRILNCDTIYPEVRRAVQAQHADFLTSAWRVRRDRLMDARFGCWDSWSTAFQAHGHHAEEFVLDMTQDHDYAFGESWDLIIVQNIGFAVPEFWCTLRERTGAKLIGHFSHAAPSDAHLACFDLLLTAFPHYAKRYDAQGLPIRYLPLAFDPRRLMGAPEYRDLPVTFVGGLGVQGHWKAGQHAISTVAERFPGDFMWWGYVGPDGVTPALDVTYRGEAWGVDYFDKLARSRATLNRHGEVHERNACNMRLFEATGMGALLLTEDAPNIRTLFDPWSEVITYANPSDLEQHVRWALSRPERVAEIALAGQARCLKEHTYLHRVQQLLEWLDA